MKKRIITTLAIGLLIMVILDGISSRTSGISASSGVPKLINYQGKLTDSIGEPLTGVFSMTFAVYDAEVGGNLLWEEGPRDVTVNEGLFSVLLGEVNPIPLEVFDGDSVWMELAVEGETMDQRKRMVSVGYAFRAEDAVNDWGKPGVAAELYEGETKLTDKYVNVDGDVMTGDLHVDGKIGIGTTTPEDKLHILGNPAPGTVQNILRLDTGSTAEIPTGVGIEFTSGPPPIYKIAYARVVGGMVNYGHDIGFLSFGVRRSGDIIDAPSEVMRLTSEGNIGIGTSEPEDKLHILGNPAPGTVQNILRLDTGSVADNTGVGIEFTSGPPPVYKIAYARIVGGIVKYGPDIGFLSFGVRKSGDNIGAPSEVMRLTSEGNVGIGTTNPQSKLAVNGTITAKEVIVTLDGWPDFVFEDDYKPTPISELEQSIKKNKHLPGIPSAKEVAANGVNVGEMQAKLLQKIEELTLYMIDLKKENEMLKKRVSSLENIIVSPDSINVK
ncbi:hypothetical protein H8E77_19570 [bacterium]|nr:hypothetical protein [bacterium]